MQKPIYLDYNASTPVANEVLTAMLPYFTEDFGNPSSNNHMWGWRAQKAVEKARSQVANLIGAEASEIYFTSGATESNNWALKGLVDYCKSENPSAPIHILTSQVEHHSILAVAEDLKLKGIEVDFLPVNSYGQVELKTIQKFVKPHTKLISLIWANNEIGSLNPMHEIAQWTHSQKIYLHSDATQAVGKVAADLKNIHIDLLSLSSHKLYGPKGVGALYIRNKNPKVSIKPFIIGGGQERSQRSGTLNVPGIVGLGAACELAEKELTDEALRLKKIRDEFLETMQKTYPKVKLNGHPSERMPNHLSLCFPGLRMELIMSGLSSIAASHGSACQSAGGHGSHVLKAIGLSEIDAQSSIRLSFGRPTTEAEAREAALRISSVILEKLSNSSMLAQSPKT